MKCTSFAPQYSLGIQREMPTVGMLSEKLEVKYSKTDGNNPKMCIRYKPSMCMYTSSQTLFHSCFKALFNAHGQAQCARILHKANSCKCNRAKAFCTGKRAFKTESRD